MNLFNMPLNLIQRVVGTITLNFTCSLEKLFLLRPNWVVKAGWTGIKKFISEETANKVDVLGDSDLGKLQQFIDPSQLEKKFGGSHPDLKEYWLPTNTLES